MNRQSMLGLTASGLIGLASSVHIGIANAQDTGKNVISTLNAPKPTRSLFTGDPGRQDRIPLRADCNRSEDQSTNGECVHRGSDAASA